MTFYVKPCPTCTDNLSEISHVFKVNTPTQFFFNFLVYMLLLVLVHRVQLIQVLIQEYQMAGFLTMEHPSEGACFVIQQAPSVFKSCK